ncbi:MAG TPA: tRNA (adenosine(37)-N6)-dimethylallyltransferase MiaA [Ignavibacteria bacterium]|nr:tRNA (adenosine(37)-N6)-dimethylallyltransferase MiaA [Ignavibacteria bacterium]HMQ98920.1 tRNA (adenosine(37)-N6)-dimethylallyltransferase MiaA [Ignavibacteria bacterium]
MKKHKVIVITGPTASGKTSLALQTAQNIKDKTGKIVEIISADSRQVYKHIPITTAQPAREELSRFRHHFVNTLELEEEFNAGEFGAQARILIDKLFDEGKIPLVVGGSGLYVNSLVYGFFEIGSDDKQLAEKFKIMRDEIYKLKEEKGFPFLLDELKKYDPVTFARMKEVKERRVIRALEVFYVTGIPISRHQSHKIDVNFDAEMYCIQIERSELYERINKRTDFMLNSGMIEEIKSLKDLGYNYKTHNSLNTVGAREIFDFLDGLITKERMTELIKQNTRRFAKRQLTWFRRDENIKWIEKDSEIFGMH